MDISLDVVAKLSPDIARRLIPQWLGSFVEISPDLEATLVEGASSLLARASDEEIAGALVHMVEIGSEYKLYPANRLARDLGRIYMTALTGDAEIHGLDNLRAAVEAGPCLLLSNHLAYCDTQSKDLLLSREGADDIAESIVAVAGPKVYGTVFRRMASSGLSTLKTAQSSNVVHNEAALTLREVGQIAIETVRRSRELMSSGRPVLIYAEGSRSRDGRLQSFFKAVRKYASVPGLRVVPLAITGTDRMMPLGQTQMYAQPVAVRVGEGIMVDPYDRPAAIESAWKQIASLLPEENQPDPATPAMV